MPPKVPTYPVQLFEMYFPDFNVEQVSIRNEYSARVCQLDWVVAVGAGAAESSSAVGDHLTGLSGAALAPFERVLGIHVQAEVGQLVVRREVAAHATGKHAAEAIRRGESQRSVQPSSAIDTHRSFPTRVPKCLQAARKRCLWWRRVVTQQ